MSSAVFDPKIIVSTDLDGTLLDHHTYEWHAMLPALEVIKEKNILLVFNTSKTLLEARALQLELGLDAPMIVENGSAIAIPCGLAELFSVSEHDTDCQLKEGFVVKRFGKARSEITQYLRGQREKLGALFESYSDWSVETIMVKTGLDEKTARMSNAKEFSEPFVWLGAQEQLDDFIESAQKKEFQVLQGGRFFHLLGNTDKSIPLIWLQEKIKGSLGVMPKLVCLGDNKNDVKMLDAADFPVVVKSPICDFPEINGNNNTIFTQQYGPVGWNSAVLKILENN
ncbi:MAG: HAD-IIB family hydrolase [Agarilytica sp.]